MTKSIVFALASLLLLQGCNTIIQQPPASQLYSLRPVEQIQTRQQTFPVNLIVSRPTSSPGLERDLIPLIRPDNQLSYYSLARWSAPTPDLVRFFLIDSLQNQNRFQSVTPESRFSRDNYRLDVHIQDFQAEYETESSAPKVHVRMTFTLTQLAKRAAVTSFVENHTLKVENNRMTKVVGAFEQALKQATTRAVQKIAVALPAAE